MKHLFFAMTLMLLIASCKPEKIEINTDPDPENFSYNNITATDALNRTLPSWEEVGSSKEKKQVGIFYWTWHTQLSKNGQRIPYNLTEMLEGHPEAIHDYNHPLWPKDPETVYFWGEPLFGYYLDTDEWVLRKHAELLAMAGVDVVIFDCTNGSFTWKESYMALCKTFMKARQEGVDTPKIAFLLAFFPTDGSKIAIEEIYNDLYKPGYYKDLFFMWEGKPLIMAYPDNVSPEIKNYFTFRPGQAAYNIGPTRNDQWGWLQIYPQHGFAKKGTGYEEVPVGVAQNWSKKRLLTNMNSPDTFGRSYTDASGQKTDKDAVNYGYNFQEQWERVLQLDPQFVFVTGWNEWNVGRFKTLQGQGNAFPDEFSQEKSRDIEPMRRGHGDNYYYQLAANIRRFKGVDKLELASPEKSITIDGVIDEWEKVRPIYKTSKGNTLHRDHPGWQGYHFSNATGRNDFVSTRVARDKDNLYFLVETAENITPITDKAWMWLLINTDRNRKTGWEGYDFMLNRTNPTATTLTVEKNSGGWKWEKCGEASYKVSGKVMEIKRFFRNLE